MPVYHYISYLFIKTGTPLLCFTVASSTAVIIHFVPATSFSFLTPLLWPSLAHLTYGPEISIVHSCCMVILLEGLPRYLLMSVAKS